MSNMIDNINSQILYVSDISRWNWTKHELEKLKEIKYSLIIFENLLKICQEELNNKIKTKFPDNKIDVFIQKGPSILVTIGNKSNLTCNIDDSLINNFSDHLGYIIDTICGEIKSYLNQEGKMKITKSYLRENKDHTFVFGDNLKRKGYGGAATLRDEPNTFGFITKKAPNNSDGSFYKPEEYENKFNVELKKLIKEIENNPEKTFLISKLGGGLANKYNIFQKVIKPGLECLNKYKNVKFLY